MEQWHVVTDEPYNTSSAGVTFEAEIGEFTLKVWTKWDGCSHLWIRETTEPDEEASYFHICDMAEFIAALQAMQAKALAYFDGEFGVAPLNDAEVQPKIDALKLQEVEFEQAPSGLLIPKTSPL